jgi:hypothetical protein
MPPERGGDRAVGFCHEFADGVISVGLEHALEARKDGVAVREETTR